MAKEYQFNLHRWTASTFNELIDDLVLANSADGKITLGFIEGLAALLPVVSDRTVLRDNPVIGRGVANKILYVLEHNTRTLDSENLFETGVDMLRQIAPDLAQQLPPRHVYEAETPQSLNARMLSDLAARKGRRVLGNQFKGIHPAGEQEPPTSYRINDIIYKDLRGKPWQR